MSFKVGDRVRFKSDPEQQEYQLSLRNSNDTWELEFPDDPLVSAPDYVPERLLERVAPKPQTGELWKYNGSNHVFFIVDTFNDGSVRYAHERSVTTVDADASVFNERYSRVYP